MSNVPVEVQFSNPEVSKSFRSWFLEKARCWINGLLEGELSAFLRRRRYERGSPNHRNGYRPRWLNMLGLGRLAIRVPRDRQGQFKSSFLPQHKGQDQDFESFIAECFLAGLSTRDITRISEKHLGKRYDSKQVSRIVARASKELDEWVQRPLSGVTYKFLFVDGVNIKVRVGQQVYLQSFCVVLGISESKKTYEVLAVTMGDRECAALWEDVFAELVKRGLDVNGVELGIMDGLTGLETAFAQYFPRAQTQRCQIHAKRRALARVRKKEKKTFSQDLNRIFYALTEADARKQLHQLKEKWSEYHAAVKTIERDLDSLLRFFQFDPIYWTTIRTTNPIERLNKEVKRRTRAMEITGGEMATYRILAYIAMTMEYNWSFNPVTNWAYKFKLLNEKYTQNAA
jgi:putative transposase